MFAGMYGKRLLSFCLSITVFLSCHGLSLDYFVIESGSISADTLKTVDFSAISLDSLRRLSVTSINRGRSIGLFGGSYTLYAGSNIVKDSWSNYLDDTVTDYGRNGFGFSCDQGSIQDEVDGCDTKDIYVLWASTNDFRMNRIVGDVTDYSEVDDFNESHRVSQCGGINYCIKRLREKNPDGLIVMISSSIFIQSENGYEPDYTNATGVTLAEYVERQKECCHRNGVPFLNLMDSIELEGKDFREDGVHYYPSGYEKLVLPTTVLLARPEWFL